MERSYLVAITKDGKRMYLVIQSRMKCGEGGGKEIDLDEGETGIASTDVEGLGG